jgi:hypothetical protein
LLLEFSDRVHNLIEIRLPTEIHLSHSLVIFTKAIFQTFARSQTKGVFLSEVVAGSSFAEKMLFVRYNFVEKVCVLRYCGVSTLMPGNHHKVVVVSEDPFRNLGWRAPVGAAVQWQEVSRIACILWQSFSEGGHS